jgi:Flp pilus assembly protein TadD
MTRWLMGMVLVLLLLAGVPVAAQDVPVCGPAALTGNPPPEVLRAVISACDVRLEVYGGDWNAYFVRGYAHLLIGENAQAAADFSKTLFFSPKDYGAFNNRGVALQGLGEDLAALADYSRVLALNPQYTLARISRAWAYWEAGAFALAEADAKYLISNGAGPAGHYLLGQFAAQAGEWARAVAAFSAALRSMPGMEEAYLQRGYAYLQLGERALAAPDYLHMLEHQSRQAPAPALTLDGRPAAFTLPGGVHHRVSFVARAGDRLTARMTALQAGVDPMLLLLGPEGQPLTVDDDGGAGAYGLDALLSAFTIPRDGRYTLVIGCAGGGDRGEVRLALALHRASVVWP